MGKKSSTGKHLSRRVAAATMSLVMVLALTPAAAFADADVNGDAEEQESAEDWDDWSEEGTEIGNVRLNKTSFLYTGEVVTPKVTVYDYDDEILDSKSYELSYQKYDENAGKYVEVKASELVGVGDYRVTATAKEGSGYSGEDSTGFDIFSRNDLGKGQIRLGNASSRNSDYYYVKTGKPIAPEVTVYDYDDRTLTADSYTLTYQKYVEDEEAPDDSDYVDIGSSKIVEVGDYQVVAKAKSRGGYTGSISVGFKVIDSKNLNYGSLDITNLDDESEAFPYTGKPAVPEIVVTDVEDNVVAADNYTLSYVRCSDDDEEEGEDTDVTSNELIEPGKYYVIATAKTESGYTGGCSDWFRIESPKDPNSLSYLELDRTAAGYDDDEGTFEYMGKPIELKLSVWTEKGEELSSKDYTLSYERRTGGDEDNDNATYAPIEASQVVEPGTYRVTATGKTEKGYSGSCSKTFYIVGHASLKDGTIETSKENYPKTGNPIIPPVAVRTESTTVDSKFYDLSYEKAIGKDAQGNVTYIPIQTSQVINAGEYRVTATAKKGSGYVGKCSTTFYIFERTDLAHGSLDVDSYCFYTGDTTAPDVRVFDYDGHLVSSDAYVVSYETDDNESEDEYVSIDTRDVVEPGEYRVTVTGLASKGYTGSCSESFRVIRRTDLNYADVSMNQKFFYTGKAIEPELTMRDAAGKVISPEDCLITYERDTGGDGFVDDYVDVKANELIEPGEYSVNIEPKPGSDYTGSRSVVFSIVDGTSLSDGGMVAGRYWYPKTGKSFDPDFTVFDGSGKVVDPKYYELSYKQRIESEEDPDVYKEIEVDAAHVLETGKYIVTATAKNGSGYTGNCSVGFTIYDSNEMHDWWLTAGETYFYTGKTIKPNITVKDGNGATISPDEYTLSYRWVDNAGDGYGSIADVDSNHIVRPGTYHVRVVSKDGKDILSSWTRDIFSVYKPNDFNGASFEIANEPINGYGEMTLAYNDVPITLNPNLVGADGQTINPKNYTLTCKKLRGGYSDDGVTIGVDQVTGPGWYRISANAKAGSGYTGSVSVQLHIVEPDEVDRAAAQWLNEQIATLPTEVTSAEQWRTVKDADQAYNRLEDAGMALIGAESLSKLKAAVASADSYIEKQEAQQQSEQPSTPADPTTPSKTDQPSSKTDQPSTSDTPATSDDVTKPAIVTEATLNVKTVTAAAVKKALGANASTVTKVTLGKKVKTVKSGAFKGTKVKTLVVKTTKLTKKSVKKALKGSKVKTIQVKVGSKKANSKYLKKYKKIFTKKVCGKKVKVKL